MFLTLLYYNLIVVFPAKAGIQVEKTGFRIKSGMTTCVKSFLTQYTIETIRSMIYQFFCRKANHTLFLHP